jgi:hypothetical protein
MDDVYCFGGNPLDRSSERRDDGDWIAKLQYIMDLADDMPTAVAKEMPSPQEIAACRWLPDDELAVYADEYQRIGSQGGLNWYRSRSGGGSANYFWTS